VHLKCPRRLDTTKDVKYTNPKSIYPDSGKCRNEEEKWYKKASKSYNHEKF
jgi:hypothetical protein